MSLLLPLPSLPPPRLGLCLSPGTLNLDLCLRLTRFPLAAPACGPTWLFHVARVGGGRLCGPHLQQHCLRPGLVGVAHLLRQEDTPSVPFLHYQRSLNMEGKWHAVWRPGYKAGPLLLTVGW